MILKLLRLQSTASIYFVKQWICVVVISGKSGFVGYEIEDNELMVKIPIKMVIQRHMVG